MNIATLRSDDRAAGWGQNVLLKQMVEDFCSRWTPGGHVLYIGDADKDDPIFEEARLRELGIELDKHGKFPDLIVHLPDRDWLVLLEAASSHGPVDASGTESSRPCSPVRPRAPI